MTAPAVIPAPTDHYRTVADLAEHACALQETLDTLAVFQDLFNDHPDLDAVRIHPMTDGPHSWVHLSTPDNPDTDSTLQPDLGQYAHRLNPNTLQEIEDRITWDGSEGTVHAAGLAATVDRTHRDLRAAWRRVRDAIPTSWRDEL